jgi:outer membrane protein assembly factor BamB
VTPAVVLLSTVVLAMVLRLEHPTQRLAACGTVAAPPPLAGAPWVRPESLPAATSVPASAAVPAGAPHMLHGDAHHSHRAHGRLPREPLVAWTFQTDGPIEAQIVASPDEGTLYVATLGGSLWALDRAGLARFHVRLGDRVYATPCIGRDGLVYVGSDGGAFSAIAPDGHIVWKLETPGDADTGAVLLEDGTVVFAAGPRVYGVRPGGVLAFRFQAKGKVFTAPAIATTAGGEPRIIVGSQDDRVYALTVRGEVAWSTDLGHDVDGAATIGDDGAIYVGTDGHEVVRLDVDGTIVWRADVGGFVRGTLSVARDGDVLAGVYGPSPKLVRVSPEGLVLGAFPVRGNGTGEVGVFGGALEDDEGALAFGAQDGRLHVVGADGRERWAYDLHADLDAPITFLGDGSLAIGDYAGLVVALKETR